MTDLSLLQPSLAESNLLCKVYFESVDPFIKLLHQSHFGKELDQYRRGAFLFPHDYEALLFCMYLLAVNSLRAEIVERIFSTPKQALVARFRHAAQAALARVNFFITDKVMVLQATLHYLVRPVLVSVFGCLRKRESGELAMSTEFFSNLFDSMTNVLVCPDIFVSAKSSSRRNHDLGKRGTCCPKHGSPS
jgi:hypothetical protein